MNTLYSHTKDHRNQSKTAILEKKIMNTWMNTVDSLTKDHHNKNKTAILEKKKDHLHQS